MSLSKTFLTFRAKSRDKRALLKTLDSYMDSTPTFSYFYRLFVFQHLPMQHTIFITNTERKNLRKQNQRLKWKKCRLYRFVY